jgi:choline dehydrogenase-like flavoprotein
MQLVSIDEAAKTRWDAIVVGTSFAAMFFVKGLNRRKNHRILFVERGRFATHAEQVKDIGLRRPEAFAQTNTSGAPKEWTATKIFGGNSNCWSACIPRLHPNDFRHGALYGRGQDWPISYGELEKFYLKAEALMDANGGGSDGVLPRSAPFPFPPHKGSAADLRMRERDAKFWFAQPTARSNGGRRNQCCANGICTMCPVNAKFTIENSMELFDTDQSRYLLGVEARRVVVEAGRATGVVVRADGKEVELKGDVVALGANAISNAAILLRSGLNNSVPELFRRHPHHWPRLSSL